MIFWENGFYSNQNEDNSRKEISEERWQELLEAQRSGLEIYTEESGYPNVRKHQPTQEELKEGRIAELKVLLTELDADINACQDGGIKTKTEAELRSLRMQLRNELRGLLGKQPIAAAEGKQ